MEKCHASPYGGHFAANKTTQKILQSGFYWLTIFKDCFEWVKHCNNCQRMGNIRRRNEMPHVRNSSGAYFYVWGIYFMGSFPSSFGNIYIFLAVDYVFKWVEA